MFSFPALNLSDDLTAEDKKRNIHLVKGALETTFIFPLSVDDIVESSLILKQNIVTLVAQFFDWFERKHSTKSGDRPPKVQSCDKLSDETANQLSVAGNHQESQSLQQAAGGNSEGHDHADGQPAIQEKPPLPSTSDLPGTKHQQPVFRQDLHTDSVYQKSVGQASLPLSSQGDVAGGVPHGVPRSSFGHVHEDSHPAHWKHVPLKRGRWMSRSLDIPQRGLAVDMPGQKGSEDTNGDYNGPSPLMTTWREQRHAVSNTQPGILNETFSYNHQKDGGPVDDNEHGSDTVDRNDAAEVVENQVEVFTEDVEIDQHNDMVAMSDDVAGEEGRETSGHLNELHQQSRGEDQQCYVREQPASKDLTDPHQPTMCSDEQKAHPCLEACHSQVEVEQRTSNAHPEAPLSNQQMEHSQPAVESSTPKLSPELLVLRLKLEEKRRRIEQERHQVEAQWEEHRRRVGEIALLEALRRAKSGAPSSSKKPSPLVSSKKGIGHRNKWLERGQGGVGGKKQEQEQKASYQKHPEEAVPVTDSTSLTMHKEGVPVQQGSDDETSFSNVAAARDADEPMSRPDTHQAPNCTGFALSEASSHAPDERVGSSTAVQPSVSSVSMATHSADTFQLSQPRPGSEETAAGDKPVGFFIGGWGSDDNKVSLPLSDNCLTVVDSNVTRFQLLSWKDGS